MKPHIYPTSESQSEDYVIVAGGTGFVGTRVIGNLLSAGFRVICISRQSPSLSWPTSDKITNEKIKDGLKKKRLLMVRRDLLFYKEGFDSRKQLADDIRSQAKLKDTSVVRAIVNLVGIRCEERNQTFENVHIIATEHLTQAAIYLQVDLFVHITVACSRPDITSAYHNTKYESEEVVGTAFKNKDGSFSNKFTILRPTIIFGVGDQVISSLVGSVKMSCLFPLVGMGTCLHQPVYVGDVATAVVRAIQYPSTCNGKTYEIAGTQQLSLKKMVDMTGEALQIPVIGVPIPSFIQYYMGSVGTYLMGNKSPLPSPSQLIMLSEGMTGDSRDIHADLFTNSDLDDNKRYFTPDTIRDVDQELPCKPYPLPFSCRLLPSTENYQTLQQVCCPATLGPIRWVAPLLWTLLLILPLFLNNLWLVTIVFNIFACILVFFTTLRRGIPWKNLWWGYSDMKGVMTVIWSIVWGGVWGLLLVIACKVGFAMICWIVPEASVQKEELHGILDEMPNPLIGISVMLLVIIVEEIVWRGTILLSLVAFVVSTWGRKGGDIFTNKQQEEEEYSFSSSSSSSFSSSSSSSRNKNNIKYSMNSENSSLHGLGAIKCVGTAWICCILGAGICASAHLFLGPILLTISTFALSVAWGIMFLHTRNLLFVIVVHMVFDLFALYIWPL